MYVDEEIWRSQVFTWLLYHDILKQENFHYAISDT